MKDEVRDDQNRKRHAQKPKKPVFHDRSSFIENYFCPDGLRRSNHNLSWTLFGSPGNYLFQESEFHWIADPTLAPWVSADFDGALVPRASSG
jgi:hypothetical protein